MWPGCLHLLQILLIEYSNADLSRQIRLEPAGLPCFFITFAGGVIDMCADEIASSRRERMLAVELISESKSCWIFSSTLVFGDDAAAIDITVADWCRCHCL